jgi:hypothetical protein
MVRMNCLNVPVKDLSDNDSELIASGIEDFHPRSEDGQTTFASAGVRGNEARFLHVARTRLRGRGLDQMGRFT